MNSPPDQTTANAVPNSIEVLHDLATTFGAQVMSTTTMLIGGPVFTHRLRARYREHRIDLLANPDLIRTDVEGLYGQFAVFCINPRLARARRGPPAYILHVAGVGRPVFNDRRELSAAQTGLVESGALERILGVIEPREGEEIEISQQLVRAFLRNPAAQRIMAVINAVVDLMPHEEKCAEQDAFDDLPDALRPLIPLVTKWGISDDTTRSKKLRRCARSTRQRLAGTVVPLIPAINQFLDQDSSEESCAWGDLATCWLSRLQIQRSRGSRLSETQAAAVEISTTFPDFFRRFNSYIRSSARSSSVSASTPSSG